MVNVLNKKISEELNELFKDAEECVLVDFHGLTVDEVNTLRSSLTSNSIQMQVVKTSLTHRVFQEKELRGYEEMLKGPTAVVWGGEGIVQVSKSIHEFAKKSKKLKIKGGLLGQRVMDAGDVKKLTTVPDRPVQLAILAGYFVSPLQGIANGMNQILSSLANLIDALHDKKEGQEAA